MQCSENFFVRVSELLDEPSVGPNLPPNEFRQAQIADLYFYPFDYLITSVDREVRGCGHCDQEHTNDGGQESSLPHSCPPIPRGM